jgi:hypothetical protein
MTTNKANTDGYDVTYHGAMISDFFQGWGVSFTKYNYCYTGVGSNPAQAYEDAILQAESSGELTDEYLLSLPTVEEVGFGSYDGEELEEGVYHYVSIRVV